MILVTSKLSYSKLKVKFYLGTHMVHWLWTYNVPFFVSNRRLLRNKNYKPANVGWALDSGGFSELSMYGEWRTSPQDYVQSIKQYLNEIGRLHWAAPQDWMCEPFIIQKTKLSVPIHQEKTIDSFIYLSSHFPNLIIPVLQGFEFDDYHRHVDMYMKRGIDLRKYKTVGVGSVCRRQATSEIQTILQSLSYLKLHGFGVKQKGLTLSKQYLKSADSLAWAFNANYDNPLPGCTHLKCSSCIRYALKWRRKVVSILREPSPLLS